MGTVTLAPHIHVISGLLLLVLLTGCVGVTPQKVIPQGIAKPFPPETYIEDKTSPFYDDVTDAIKSDIHYAYLLETGDDALLARIYLSRNARHSIDIQTFIWKGDALGRFLFVELWRAAVRGVRVRLLIDDLSLRENADYVAYLSTLHPNIQVKQYNPLAENINAGVLGLIKGYGLNFQQANQRMHNKIYLVDGTFGITGGRNYANDYFDRGIDRNFKDRDVLITGPAVGDMATSFDTYWAHHLSVSSLDMLDVQHSIQSNTVNKPEAEIGAYEVPIEFRKLTDCARDNQCIHERITKSGYAVQHVEFVADVPGKLSTGQEISNTSRVLAEHLRAAKKSVLMQTPYLVIDKFGTDLFATLRKQNPALSVTVSTNSLGAADHFYAYAYSYENKKKYLKKFRWRLHEMKPDPADLHDIIPTIDGVTRSASHYACIHAKTYQVDDELTWIGSFNLDPRSILLNTEAGLTIRDKEFAARVRQSILNTTAPQNSWAVGVRRKAPVLGFFSGVFENIFKIIPFFNVWPFQYTTSFELNENAAPVPFYHEDFYRNYHSVGQFPGSNMSTKALKTRFTKAFFGPAEPLI